MSERRLTWKAAVKASLWLVRGSIVGICIGLVISLFVTSIELASHVRSENWWLYLLLPAVAAFTVFVYKKIGKSLDLGTTLAIDAINSMIITALNPSSETDPQIAQLQHRVPLRLAPVVFGASVLSHVVGASAGKEGAGVQIGTSIAGGLSRLERHLVALATKNKTVLKRGLYNDRDLGMWLICGSGAAFGALFNAPVAGTLFGTQVASPRINRLEAMAPCLTASYIACWIANLLKTGYHRFPLVDTVALDVSTVAKVLIAAMCFGLLSRLFCIASKACKKIVSKFSSPIVGAASAAAVLAILTLVEWKLLGTTAFNGLGYQLIDTAYLGSVAWWIPLIKLSFTAITLAAALKGGEVVPLLVCGATLGSAMSGLLGLPPSLLASYGAVATLAGATKLPVVCFMLGIEFFGATNPALLFLACTVGYLTSGNLGIYQKQLL
ncbi:MAG: chloride channel protein [Sphaerochaetaceae bacterium]|jgi:H+/Cl- antiporter ClcA|nr:chloride channel protein [Sphaerochaetaceae bacterium]